LALAARAQQAKVPTLGVLVTSDPEPFRSTFESGLRRLGYVPGQSIHVEFRDGESQSKRLAELAAELAGLKVDILVGSQTPAAQALKQASSTIPIVIMAGDPVGTGLVASLARPGGNITGLSSTAAEVSAKMVELIREVLPAARRVAVLANANDPFTKAFLPQLQAGADALGVELRTFMVRAPNELDAAAAETVRWRADAVVVQPSLPRKRAIELTTQHRLPAIAPSKVFSLDGGLMSYSAAVVESYRDLAIYVDKILKGAKPADLPVQQPTKFELVVNLKTAKAIGVTIPPTLLTRADEVIE
jgi:putative ABC transport system substrate-binding protein